MKNSSVIKDYFPRQSVLAPLMAVAVNIIIVYIVYSLARVEFLLENLKYFRPALEDGSIWKIFYGGIRLDTPGIFYTNAIYILLMLLPLHLKERQGWYKMCKWVFIVINSIALIANVGDSVYFQYTLKRSSWSLFSEFGNETNAGKIISLELLRHWYLAIFVAVTVWGMWKAYVSPAMDIRRQNLVRYYIVSVLSLGVAALVTVAGIRGGFLQNWANYLLAFPLAYIWWRLMKDNDLKHRRIGYLFIGAAVALVVTAPMHGFRHRDIRPITISEINKYITRPQEAALGLNTPFSMIRSIGNVPFHDPHYFDDKKELEKIYTPLHPGMGNVEMKRKNVVIIIVESMAAEYVGAFGKQVVADPSYRGYTPFLDSLVQKSAWWKYSFDNGQKSIDAMPSVLASIPHFIRPYVVTPQAVNHVKGIPALLKEEGYATAFFHGARVGSMGFDSFAKSIGFEDYYGRENYEEDPRTAGHADFDGYWGIWDEKFLQYFAMKMSDMPQPFMTALFTLSNHHPFNIPEEYKGKFPEGTMKIHPTVGYTDNALREFFATVKKQPWYENTIFVITNDHTNMRYYDEFRSDIGAFCGPVIIYDPSGDIEPGMRDGVAQQIDIMPTLLDYLGYSKPYVAFGENLFKMQAGEDWAVNFSNGVYQYVRYGYVLQFDGRKVVGMYSIDDRKMERNVKGRVAQQSQMERELKALIQQYMDRMLQDRLTIVYKN